MTVQFSISGQSNVTI